MRQIISATEKIRTLGTSPVFSRIPSSDLSILAEMMKTERFGAGDVLFEYGDPSDTIYVIAEGSLSVFAPGGSEPVRTMGPGELLGEYGMFSALVRSATVKADTDAALLSLEYQRFRAFLLQFPESTLTLFKTTVERLVALETKHNKGTQLPSG